MSSAFAPFTQVLVATRGEVPRDAGIQELHREMQEAANSFISHWTTTPCASDQQRAEKGVV
jgi:hypothetical protein